MKVTVTSHKEKSQAELVIEVPAKDFAPFVEQAARKLSKEKPLKGFRPGHASLNVVIDAFGKERVLREAMDHALPHFFIDAVIEEDIEAISRPSITIQELGIDQPFRFLAVVDVLPEVKLGDPKQLTVEKRPVDVSDAEVERELTYLAKMRSTYLDVARPAQKEDTVTVDFHVSMNGTLMEGGESKNHPIHIGEGHFVPDFEKNLLGISAGDERTFSITFPDDFAKEDLRGKKADVKVKAHAVQKRVIPKIDDAFAQKLGKFKSIKHLKNELKKNMKKEKELKEQERYQGELMEQLASRATFGSIPAVLIEKEIDRRLEEFTQLLALQQKTIDEYLKQENKTLHDVRATMKSAAQQSVKVSLAMRALAQQENIVISDEEIEAQVQDYLKRYTSVKAAQQSIDPEELRDNIRAQLRHKKTLARLEKLAHIKESK